MASIYSDEMKEKILADFSSKNPKVSASIIERFGENPRSKGLGSLNVEEYRNAIDAPLQNTPIRASSGWGQKNALADYLKNMDMGTDELSAALEKTSVPTGEEAGFQDFLKSSGEGLGKSFGLKSILDMLSAIYSLTSSKDVDAPARAPRYKPPKPTEIEGVGGIGMAYGGAPRRYEKGSEGGIQDPILEHGDPGLIETLRFLGLSDEAIVNFVNTVGDIPEGVVDTAISLGQKARDAGLLEDPRDPDNGMNDGGTVLNRKLFLGGGEVDGIGGERDDLVPIWASDKEYVVSANGVRRMGGGNHARGIAALDEINNNGRLV